MHDIYKYMYIYIYIFKYIYEMAAIFSTELLLDSPRSYDDIRSRALGILGRRSTEVSIIGYESLCRTMTIAVGDEHI